VPQARFKPAKVFQGLEKVRRFFPRVGRKVSKDWKTHPLWIKSTLISIAVLFNPLIPIHLSRELWAVIDPITAVLLLYTSRAIYRGK